MAGKVAVVGFKFACAPDLKTTRERLVFELTRGLFDELGIDRHAVDTFIMCSNDFIDGRTISNVFLDAPAGAYLKDETKVEMEGLHAVIYGWMRILSGQYDTALVVSLGLNGSQASPYLNVQYTLSPTYDRQVGLLNELSGAALQARSYLSRSGYSEELLDLVATKDLQLAAKNPRQARRIEGVDAEKVRSSEYYYEPLRELHCYPWTDVGCVVLLASERKASDLTDKPVWIMGAGSSIETYFYGERDLSRSASAAEATKRACSLAGISDPSKEIDFAELSALFAHQEPLLAESMGLIPEGEAEKAYREGLAGPGGSMPLNPSGGSLGAHAACAGSLLRLCEAVLQIRGEAGPVQLEKAGTALVHGQDGLCAQQNAVLILGA